MTKIQEWVSGVLLGIVAVLIFFAWLPICGGWLELHSDAFYEWIGKDYLDKKGRDLWSGIMILIFVFANIGLTCILGVVSVGMLTASDERDTNDDGDPRDDEQ